MATIARRIIGPQDDFERTGSQSYRDIRPVTVRLSQALRTSASGLVLTMVAAGTFVEPALVDLAVPLSMLYALWVLTRRVTLPIRLPSTSNLTDYSNPTPGSREAKKAGGRIFIGWDLDGQELWITSEDARQHMTLPGTTGAGKTSALISLLCNSLAQGSGFVLVDGKADRSLFGTVLALARRFGREDDVRVLNFMVASGVKDSHRFNPFAVGNADSVREMLVSQLGEQTQNDTNGVFRDRAVALIGTMAPALVWLRDHKGLPLNIEIIRSSVLLPAIWQLAMKKVFVYRNPQTGDPITVEAQDIPEPIIHPLRAYLGELPGYDPAFPLENQKGEKPAEQHGFAVMYFTATFQQLSVSLGHIFNCENGDIDMRDVVLNRRILVVNLPALENSDATLAALGKLVVSGLRGMMAELCGCSLEGDYTEVNKPGMGPAPFPIVLDELAYYATSGLDRMLAMGRGLNLSFMLGFQEVSGIWARLGEKTASLLGNTNTTIAMRQQDAGRTREWLEKTAGQTNVTQATSYQGSADGAYREARHAEVRTVSRVDWNDLTSLIEGEAIVLFGGRRIYARLFHAKIDDTGPKRLGWTLRLPSPDPVAIHARLRAARQIASVIESGRVTMGTDLDRSPGLEAFVSGFEKALRSGCNTQGCVRSALAAVADLPDAVLPLPPKQPADGMPYTSSTAMLAASSEQVFSGPDSSGLPNEPISDRLLRNLCEIEGYAGTAVPLVRAVALAVIADRDDAIADLARIEPPPMSAEVLEQTILAVTAGLSAISAASEQRPEDRRPPGVPASEAASGERAAPPTGPAKPVVPLPTDGLAEMVATGRAGFRERFAARQRRRAAGQ